MPPATKEIKEVITNQQPVDNKGKKAVEAATKRKAGLGAFNCRKQKAKKREVKYSTLSNMFGL